MLAGLEKPTKGEIVIAGQHIEKLNENQLVAFRRERVGFIFQSYNLLGTMNAVENVALPLSFRGVRCAAGAVGDEVEKYLKMVGLEKSAIICRTRCPAGSSSVSALHGRWWYIQRSFFADEPTGNLDSHTTMDVLKLMQRIVREQNLDAGYGYA